MQVRGLLVAEEEKEGGRKESELFIATNSSDTFSHPFSHPMLPSPAYGSRPERLAKSSLQDCFIPNPKPVYSGAFPDPFSSPIHRYAEPIRLLGPHSAPLDALQIRLA